jgi:Domain of unknown function (DUF4124)
MRAPKHIAAASRRMRVPLSYSTALVGFLLSLNSAAQAGIFRCIDANGTSTFSDRACEPKRSDDAPAPATPSAASGSETYARRLDSPREKKAAHILDLLRIAPVEPEGMLLRRTVDDAAPDLVKALDPDNSTWTPANGRWHSVSEFVKADLRRDAQSALRSSTAQVAQITAREYAAHANDSDMDALSTFLSTPEGTRYVAFQNEIRPLLYSALSSVLAQEPTPSNEPSELELHQRRQLLYMTLEYRIIKDGGGPSSADLQPGSKTVVENAVRREGTTLDALFTEYEASLPSFQSFTDSVTAKHFFAAVEPALRTELALSSTATTDFAEQEFDRYFQRWRAIYGPGMRVTSRTTIYIRGRMVSISHTVITHPTSASQSPEAMAIQCEQRENSAYQVTHRFVTNYNARATELKAIQNRCRAEQRLPPL